MGDFIKTNKRKILYTICFLCIMLIDWTRGSLKWRQWAACINVTGIIMAIVVGSHFSWEKISWKKCRIWLVTWFLGTIFGYFIWKIHPGTVFFAQYAVAAVSVGCLGILAIYMKQEALQQKYRKNMKKSTLFLVGIWFLLSVIFLLSKRQQWWPIWFFVLFGMFYCVPYSEQEKEDLWEGAANGVITGFFILQIFAYGFRPYDEVRYTGAYANCNINSMMYLMTFIMVLYKLHSFCWNKKEKKKLWLAFYFVLAAGLVSFILFTMTRTAIIMAFVILLVYVFLEFKVIHKKKIIQMFTTGICFGLCIFLTFPCVYLTIRYLPTILHHPIWWEGEYHENKVHSFDAYNSEKYVSIEEVLETLLGRLWSGKEEIFSQQENIKRKEEDFLFVSLEPNFQDLTENSEMFSYDKMNYDKISFQNQAESSKMFSIQTENELEEQNLLSGEEALSSMRIRLEIYKKYFSHLNIMGHTLKEGYFPITENYHAWHAQNVFLQVAFYHGIFAGVVFLVLSIGLIIKSIKLAFASEKKEDILPLLLFLVFFGYGTMECVWYLGQSILFFCYLCAKILLDSKVCKKEIRKERISV